MKSIKHNKQAHIEVISYALIFAIETPKVRHTARIFTHPPERKIFVWCVHCWSPLLHLVGPLTHTVGAQRIPVSYLHVGIFSNAESLSFQAPLPPWSHEDSDRHLRCPVETEGELMCHIILRFKKVARDQES